MNEMWSILCWAGWDWKNNLNEETNDLEIEETDDTEIEETDELVVDEEIDENDDIEEIETTEE